MADLFGPLPLPPDRIEYPVYITPEECLASDLCRNLWPELAQQAIPPPHKKAEGNFFDHIPILSEIRRRFFQN